MTKFLTDWERRQFESITSSWAIPNTHPYEPSLARMNHHSLHLAVSLDRFAKLMVLHPHMNCPKLEARSKHGLGSVPFLQALLSAMLTVQYLSPNEDRFHGQL
jgi:hypothetical protein